MSHKSERILSIERRLRAVVKNNVLTVCIGSVYLDAEVSGIKLEGGQHVLDFSQEIITKVHFRPGGSAYYVADYLNRLGRKPLLVSMIGEDSSGDFFSSLLVKAGLDDAFEGVFKNPNGETAVTVHMICHEVPNSAMYTDRGVLRRFGWAEVNSKLGDHSFDKGAIYISGLLKTDLHQDLNDNIDLLQQKGGIVFLDHGRLYKGLINDEQKNELKKALPLVDVYFSNRAEFNQLVVEVLDEEVPELTDPEKSLEVIVQRLTNKYGNIFPPIMLIQDVQNNFPGILICLRMNTNSAYDLSYIKFPFIRKSNSRVVGLNNIFNAIFIDEFLKSEPPLDMTVINKCANKAKYFLEWIKSGEKRNISDAITRWNSIEKSVTAIETQKEHTDANENFSRSQLRKVLCKRLGISDVRNICFDLDLDYENLPGESLESRIVGLLELLISRQQLQRLFTWLDLNRTDIDLNLFR